MSVHADQIGTAGTAQRHNILHGWNEVAGINELCDSADNHYAVDGTKRIGFESFGARIWNPLAVNYKLVLVLAWFQFL